MVDVITTVSTHKEAISVSVEKDMKLIITEEYAQVSKLYLDCNDSVFIFKKMSMNVLPITEDVNVHNCTNTIGSFSCSCTAGYSLVSEKLCTGEINFNLHIIIVYHILIIRY